MITDRARVRRTDPGHHDSCDVCQMNRLVVSASVADEFDEGRRSARSGCADHKSAPADALIEYLAPITERMNYYRERQDEVRDIVMEGAKRAREEAGRVMGEVRRAMKISWV